MDRSIIPFLLEPDLEFLVLSKAGEWIPKQEIIGYKKIMCRLHDGTLKYVVAQVTVPAGAMIVRPYSRIKWYKASNKLRTNEYKIERIFVKEYDIIDECFSIHDPKFKYKEGQTYKVNCDRSLEHEFAKGLHFFLSMAEALDYG